jgi:cell division septal protein FtsQ
MFNKNKLDKRVRFQSQSFRQQLDRQRNYKRDKKTVPQTDWGVFLSTIGLGSTLSKILSLLALCAIIYLVYIPNFLFVKNIQFMGLSESQSGSVKGTTEEFLNKHLPWPQKNLLLLSKNKLNAFLVKNNQNVLKVEKIEKDFPNGLKISITPRTEKFLVDAPNGIFTVANDGLIKNQLAENLNASTSLPSGLIFIKLKTKETIFAGKNAFPSATADFLLQAYGQLPKIIKNQVEKFEISEPPDYDITALTNSGFKIYLDLKSDLPKILQRFDLVFSQISDGDKKNLSYIDMRFAEKGYVCLKTQPCANVTIPAVNQATSTPENLTP